MSKGSQDTACLVFLQMERHAVEEARKFLESRVDEVKDPHSTALVAYALTLLHSPKASLLLTHLYTMAYHTGMPAVLIKCTKHLKDVCSQNK